MASGELQLIGTPMPREDKEADQFLTRKQREEKYQDKFVPLWKQEVRDKETGKKILRGAFNGGWLSSVGYHGTVGSKEGWTPSEFVSSRDKRAQVRQRPEDFMDEEDKQELGLGTDLSARSDFDSFDGLQRQQKNDFDIASFGARGAAIPGPVPMEFFSPKADPIGKRLLRLMGWREGQGVGPRIRTRRKFSVKPEGDSDDEEAPMRGRSVAPENTQVIQFEFKDNTFGIGYDRFEGANEFRERRNVPVTEKSKNRTMTMGSLFTRGSGYDDEEDFSIYDNGIQSFGNFMTEIEYLDDEPDIEIQTRKSAPKSKVLSATTPTFVRRGTKAGIIAGFVLSMTPLPQPNEYPPPDVPASFNPVHIFPSDSEPIVAVPDRALYDMAMQMPSFMREQMRREANQKMNASLRGKILGEVSLLQKPNEKPEEEEDVQIVDAKDILFRPLTGFLADKFVDTDTIQRNENKAMDKPEVTFSGEYVGMGYGLDAANLGMYGRLTRQVDEWRPENLLCKRFNVAYQKGPKKADIVKETQTRAEVEAETKKLVRELHKKKQMQIEKGNDKNKKPENEEQPQNTTIIEEKDIEEIETIEVEKPSIDLFKAIFEDDGDLFGDDFVEEENNENQKEMERIEKEKEEKEKAEKEKVEKEKEPVLPAQFRFVQKQMEEEQENVNLVGKREREEKQEWKEKKPPKKRKRILTL